MTTVYIKGINRKSHYLSKTVKYKNTIRNALYNSKLNEGDHYIEGKNALHETALYWITSRITLREFKKAIGADNIFYHRLRFIENVEDLIEKSSDQLTKKETELLNRFKNKGSNNYGKPK